MDIQRELGQMNLSMEPLAGLAEVAVAAGRVGQAMGHVEEILLHLAPEHNRSPLTLAGLKGANEPFRVCLTCVHVLEAGRSPRTREYRNRTYELLLQQADKISDSAMRRSYLERVPSHREILQVQGVRIAA